MSQIISLSYGFNKDEEITDFTQMVKVSKLRKPALKSIRLRFSQHFVLKANTGVGIISLKKVLFN